MLREIRCEGAPRDLGFDQGRACRAELRAAFGSGTASLRCRLRLGLTGSRVSVLMRDLARHFPQHSETVEGLARGSGLPAAWFAEELARNLAAEHPTPIGRSVAVVLDASQTGAAVARTLAFDPLLRRSRPEGGFASVELTLPWSTTALAGVNAGGLAAASVSLGGGNASGSCAAPAPLLVQDCLVRFDSVGGALDWCLGRPAGGRAVILFADSSGGTAAVEVAGDARCKALPKDGLLLAGGAQAAAGALRAAAPLDPGRTARILAGRVVCLDPAGRRIGLFGSGPERWFWVA